MTRHHPPLLSCRDVFKAFDEGRIPILRGVSLSVARGQTVALWGASGSGKSTLLHLLGGLDTPDSGTVSFEGDNPADPRLATALRRTRLGFVFQFHHLLTDLTVAENLRLPAIAAGRPRAETDARIGEVLGAVGIAHRADHFVRTLSGGERQRTALARALLHRPSVIIADEPTGALDEKSSDQLFALLVGIARSEGTAVVVATHERRHAEACDRLLHLRDGRLVDL